MPTLLALTSPLVAICLAWLGAAPTHSQHAVPFRAPEPEPITVRIPRWFSGDTHEHVQLCDDTTLTTDEIHARMEKEGLDLANILIWHRDLLPYTQFVCEVTGYDDPLSRPRRILRYGVETSGLGCGYWGHLIGLGVGFDQVRIAAGSRAEGDCANMSGLGFPGDGTGRLASTVAQRFFDRPGAVCGYAHSLWTQGLQHPSGYDWNTQLLASGFTTDAQFLDPTVRLAVPNVNRIFALGLPPNGLRLFMPPLAPMDAVLGNVQFLETIFMSKAIPVILNPPGAWNALYYKLLSAGARIALAGGSDRACFPPAPGEAVPRTHVRIAGEDFSFEAWARGLEQGRTTIAEGNSLILRLVTEGQEVGSDVALSSPDALATFEATLDTSIPIDDVIELVIDGQVASSAAVALPEGGRRHIVFADVPILRSSWAAARLGSLRAHTAATYLILDGRPIADPFAAEYWMLWCDIVTKTTLDHPEADIFRSQQDEALELIAKARRAFKTFRDVAFFHPSWQAFRYGSSTAACRGPITIGTTGPALVAKTARFTCVNAPPDAQGQLLVSRSKNLAGSCVDGATLFVLDDPGSLIGTYLVHSTRSGYAEVTIDPIPEETPVLFAQFVWTNPAGCGSAGCDGSSGRSASDALYMTVQ